MYVDKIIFHPSLQSSFQKEISNAFTGPWVGSKTESKNRLENFLFIYALSLKA